MPNLALVLRTEISRLARKELRAEIDGLRKIVAAQRADLAGVKRKLAELEKTNKAQAKAVRALKPEAPAGQATGKSRALRFSAEGLASQREKLGLSAADFGLLVGTSGQSIYAW